MTTIYFKDKDGHKVAVEVTDEVAAADTETRRAEWRNEAKERYYRDAKLQDLNDKDGELACEEFNPERMTVAVEESRDLRTGMKAVLKTLTPRQTQVLTLLKSGKTCLEISALLGVSKQSVNDVRNALKEKFKVFLK
jgi:DNA-binding CsgD family transcriptional regulator